MTDFSFSVCMSVYKNDNADDFLVAVRSIYNQSKKPNDIVLVVDGPIGESLHNAVNTLKDEISILNVIWLPENMGHAIARQTGLDAAKNELIAIMDSDDISVYDRFERQIAAFEQHPEVTVIGGLINEFIGETSNIVGTRIVPEHDDEIKEYMRSRCPMNLVTVMMRKSHIQKVGGYIDWYCEEDYYLWIRLALAGYRFYNIQDNLVDVRTGKGMYQRRGGWRYFKSEASLQFYMFKNGVIGFARYIYNVLIRFAVQVMMPNRLRGWVFKTFARS
ncbi:MAG: glycosyltransferase [Lentimicrobiaceae bacterium]|nr:glycosyltransferase [Lentimicrobiaceae bacterium]